MHQLPNLLTLLRLALTIPIACLLLAERHAQALSLFAVAGASDALDGFLARRFGWTSRLGSILDPLADKLLLVTSYVCLALSAVLPWWLTLLVLLRDALIVGGAALYRQLRGPFAFRPSWLGKASTLLQIVLVLAVLLELSVFPAFVVVHWPLVAAVVGLTLLSGGDYLRTWIAKFRATRLPA
ncbi:CDP-alcohol phosphatidyltransferase family protein [Pseudomonas cavernae]|uniref:CDP-diacylglycerol--glycerol-3-phosphate 3-phosphatidyltransferase n=1 Tax=Pseudomonas cavernae TaxID=2320867 RepID=A0A385Z0W3_9PSED|nr:CDP-alcohol phosphatidyltransferase family protein [Pseudomonas cavernae]AYC32160.1 CDP-alcohol phosphatidyltransferase family protein [Pseudomonas cavernae]